MTKTISVIIPAYNEESNISILYEHLKKALDAIPHYQFELIFIDDGSTDQTLRDLQTLASHDKRVQIIQFSRNFGSHAAIAAGLTYCRGNAAVIMAADLQDPPELILELISKYKNENYKIVWAVRKQRRGESWYTLFLSRFYYFLMNLLTSVKQPPAGADVVLADRTVIDAFKKDPRASLSVFMSLSNLEKIQGFIEYNKKERRRGKSGWNLRKRLNLFFNSLFCFSKIPILSLQGKSKTTPYIIRMNTLAQNQKMNQENQLIFNPTLN